MSDFLMLATSNKGQVDRWLRSESLYQLHLEQEFTGSINEDDPSFEMLADEIAGLADL